MAIMYDHLPSDSVCMIQKSRNLFKTIDKSESEIDLGCGVLSSNRSLHKTW